MFHKVARPREKQETEGAPFRVLHLQQDASSSGTFRPDARLVLAPTLRTGGIWTGLDPQDAHTLILMLSFLSPNGHCTPALSQVADALHCSSAQARMRLLRLTQREWQGQSLAVLIPRQDGNDAFAPGARLLAQEHIPPVQEQNVEPRPQRAGREAVLAYSRDRYASPRAEVEAGIAERMGWGPPVFEGDTPEVAKRKGDLFQSLTAVGVTRDQALDVLARFPLSDVEQQMAWLPLRNAKSPARFLLAAIEGNYDPPLALKKQNTAAPPPPTFAPPPDLPGLAEDVFRENERQGAEDGAHTAMHDTEREPPDEPDAPVGNQSILPEGTLYTRE